MASLSYTWHPALLALATLPFLYLIGSWALAARRPKDFPPGPPPTWGFGNALQIPLDKSFLKFGEWKETYGDIIGLKIGSQDMVILQSAEHVRELFEKRGSIYSDRTEPYITAKVINPGTILFMPHDHNIKKARTALQYLFRPAGLQRILQLQSAQSALLMRKILEDPKGFRNHMKHWALATPLSIVSGQGVKDSGPTSTSVYFNTQSRWLRFLNPAQAPPVEIFPFLKYVPGFLAQWKSEALALRKDMLKMMYHMLDGAKIQHANISKGLRSVENESLMARTLREGETSKEMSMGDHELAVFGSGILDAAVDTVFATTTTMILFFAAYPEIQQRVQAEVDSIWKDEVPHAEGLAELKYLKAVLMETMRCRPATPAALPRVVARDDTYRGFKFSKGTVLIMNAWGIQNDETWYDKPEKFNPDRYMENKWGVRPEMAAAAAKENRRPNYNFGTGRRACPGLEFAENQVLVTMAKLAWGFDVVAKGPLDVDIKTGYRSDLVLAPKAFDVDFKPRGETRSKSMTGDSEKAMEIISAWVE
nr:cytochrome p450 [Colletotrichum truncatum]KAF6799173.1 cytochrome p450 [Colletotrichum truncatum]